MTSCDLTKGTSLAIYLYIQKESHATRIKLVIFLCYYISEKTQSMHIVNNVDVNTHEGIHSQTNSTFYNLNFKHNS